MQRLNEYVRVNYATALMELNAHHVDYFFDSQHFGNELDTYTNARMRIVFIRDRGEEFVQLFPRDHADDLFSLQYLIEMVAPGEQGGGFEGFAHVPKVVERIYRLFESPYYQCYRRAYSLYENCRNLLGMKMSDGTSVIDYKP
jgi:hypothetical protein